LLAESIIKLPTREILYEANQQRKENEKLLIVGEQADVLKNLGFSVEAINAELRGEYYESEIKETPIMTDEIQRQRQERYRQRREELAKEGRDTLDLKKLAELLKRQKDE